MNGERTPETGASRLRRGLEYGLPVVLVAVLGHLAVLRTWWFHDDWVFLADAAGLADRGTTLVRVVSYQWYWHLLYPLFGLATVPWALTRLLMHAASALLTARLAGRAGLDRHGQILAGLLFAAAPVAFESLYWGTGAVELLGALFSLAALERWLCGGPRGRWWALLLAALAVGCKESGLLLPLIFAGDLVRRRSARSPLMAGTLAVVALGAAAVVLMLGDFSTSADYGLDWRSVPRNLLVFGSWLATPAVLLRDGTLSTTAGLLTGAAFWALWGWAARRGLLAGRPALTVCLGLALAAAAPAMLTGDHAVPRYLYLPAAAASIALVAALYETRGPSRRTLLLLVPLLWLVAWSGVDYHRNARHPSGRAFHRLVFKERVSRYLCHRYSEAGLADGDRVVILRNDSTDDGIQRVLEEGVAGELGLRLTVGPRASLVWTRALGPEHAGAYVFATDRENLSPRGWYNPPASDIADPDSGR